MLTAAFQSPASVKWCSACLRLPSPSSSCTGKNPSVTVGGWGGGHNDPFLSSPRHNPPPLQRLTPFLSLPYVKWCSACLRLPSPASFYTSISYSVGISTKLPPSFLAPGIKLLFINSLPTDPSLSLLWTVLHFQFLCWQGSVSYVGGLSRKMDSEAAASLSLHNPSLLLLCSSQEMGRTSLLCKHCVEGSKALPLVVGSVKFRCLDTQTHAHTHTSTYTHTYTL